MSATISIGKAKPPAREPARTLTEQWRERRKKILLNPPGKKRLELAELIREGRK